MRRGHGAPEDGIPRLRSDAQEESEMNTNKNATRGGGVQTSKKLLAALAVMAVAFVVLAAVPSVAADGDSSFSTAGTGKVAKIGTTEYETVNAAIEAASNGATIVILNNVTEDISIANGKTIVLDLAGFKLTNSSGNTITNNGTLTIIDSSEKKTGTVDNITHEKSALFNNGTATLDGGKFIRSNEAGKNAKDSGGNSYYTVLNHGVMTVNSGVTVENKGKYSSLFENGYYDYSSQYSEGTNAANPTLTINGGVFTGGLNTIKNDDGAILTIKDGSFTNYVQYAVQNHNKATIGGGSFEGAMAAVGNCPCAATYDVGELTINGGTFKGVTVEDYGTIAGKITVGAGIGISVDDRNANIVFILSEGSSVSFIKSSVLPATVSYTKDSKASTVTFSEATAGDVVKISAGSIDISGQINAATGGVITVTGDAVISESAILSNGVTLTIQDGATLTVKNGATLTVADGATVTDSNTETKFVNNGTVIVKGTVDKIDNKKTVRLYGTISDGTNDGTIVVMDKGAVVGNIAGTGSIDVSEVTETKKISGTISNGYTMSPEFQTVIVFEDLVIKEGAIMDVYGSLVINEGVKVTIENGAALVLNGSMAKLVNNGTIVVNGGGYVDTSGSPYDHYDIDSLTIL